MLPLILFRPLVPLCWVVISYPRNFRRAGTRVRDQGFLG